MERLTSVVLWHPPERGFLPPTLLDPDGSHTLYRFKLRLTELGRCQAATSDSGRGSLRSEDTSEASPKERLNSMTGSKGINAKKWLPRRGSDRIEHRYLNGVGRGTATRIQDHILIPARLSVIDLAQLLITPNCSSMPLLMSANSSSGAGYSVRTVRVG